MYFIIIVGIASSILDSVKSYFNTFNDEILILMFTICSEYAEKLWYTCLLNVEFSMKTFFSLYIISPPKFICKYRQHFLLAVTLDIFTRCSYIFQREAVLVCLEFNEFL